MAKVFKIDGTNEEITMPVPVSLEWLQGLVGGYIEFVTFADRSALMVHEEGRLLGFQPNDNATALCFFKGSPQALPIVGVAVFFSRDEMRAMDRGDASDVWM